MIMSDKDFDPVKIYTQDQMDALLRGEYKLDDSPVNPSHYSRWKIEPLTFITANNLDFLRGNIIKYIMRYDAKNGVEDLKKARVYLDKMMSDLSNEDNV